MSTPESTEPFLWPFGAAAGFGFGSSRGEAGSDGGSPCDFAASIARSRSFSSLSLRISSCSAAI